MITKEERNLQEERPEGRPRPYNVEIHSRCCLTTLRHSICNNIAVALLPYTSLRLALPESEKWLTLKTKYGEPLIHHLTKLPEAIDKSAGFMVSIRKISEVFKTTVAFLRV